jgi:hypothetical protein
MLALLPAVASAFVDRNLGSPVRDDEHGS